MGDRLATYMGRKVWGCCDPFRDGAAGSPSNTMSSGPRLYLRTKWHLDLSNRWPQHSNVTDRTKQRGQTGKSTVR